MLRMATDVRGVPLILLVSEEKVLDEEDTPESLATVYLDWLQPCLDDVRVDASYHEDELEVVIHPLQELDELEHGNRGPEDQVQPEPLPAVPIARAWAEAPIVF